MEFISSTTATPNQIEFIDLVVQELTQNGVMEPERLFQSPFKDLSAQGPIGVFPAAEVTKIIEVINSFRERAAA